jgi:hypothetical protein
LNIKKEWSSGAGASAELAVCKKRANSELAVYIKKKKELVLN